VVAKTQHSDFMALRLGVAKDPDDGELVLYGKCRDGEEYFFVRIPPQS